jgi:thiol peroxidase
MAQISFKGSPVHTSGHLPSVGDNAPDFNLTRTDLSDISLKDLKGKKIVLNIFPSVDTPVCSASVRRFNSEISRFDNALLLSVSMDLPFAHDRFCETEGLKNVIPVSEMRQRSFGEKYGVRITDGPLAGLLARAVVVLDEAGKVIHSQLVDEITTEPDYETALNALKTDAPEATPSDLNSCTTSFTAEHSRSFDMDDPCDDGRSG